MFQTNESQPIESLNSLFTAADAWEQFQSQGIVDESEVELDFEFKLSSHRYAQELNDTLTSFGYESSIESNGWLIFQTWYVKGRTAKILLTKDKLGLWLDWMAALGNDHGGSLEDWGVWISAQNLQSNQLKAA